MENTDVGGPRKETDETNVNAINKSKERFERNVNYLFGGFAIVRSIFATLCTAIVSFCRIFALGVIVAAFIYYGHQRKLDGVPVGPYCSSCYSHSPIGSERDFSSLKNQFNVMSMTGFLNVNNDTLGKVQGKPYFWAPDISKVFLTCLGFYHVLDNLQEYNNYVRGHIEDGKDEADITGFYGLYDSFYTYYRSTLLQMYSPWLLWIGLIVLFGVMVLVVFLHWIGIYTSIGFRCFCYCCLHVKDEKTNKELKDDKCLHWRKYFKKIVFAGQTWFVFLVFAIASVEIIKVFIFFFGYLEVIEQNLDTPGYDDGIVVSGAIGTGLSCLLFQAKSLLSHSDSAQKVLKHYVTQIILVLLVLFVPLLFFLIVAKMSLWFVFDVMIGFLDNDLVVDGHENYLPSIIILVSLVILFLNALTTRKFMQFHYEYSLMKSFFASGRDILGQDLEKIKPYYIVNAALMNYDSTGTKTGLDFENFIFSPKHFGNEDVSWVESRRIKPMKACCCYDPCHDLKKFYERLFFSYSLADAVALSGAAVSVDLGRNTPIRIPFVRNLLKIFLSSFSLDLGSWKNMFCRHQTQCCYKDCCQWIKCTPYAFHVYAWAVNSFITVALLVLSCGFAFFGVLIRMIDRETFNRAATIYCWQIACLLLFLLFCLESIIRVAIVIPNFLHKCCKDCDVTGHPDSCMAPLAFLRQISQVFEYPQTERSHFYYLADGGHFDNLGIYELLKRKCDVVFTFDGGEDSGQTMSSLYYVLKQLVDEKVIEERVKLYDELKGYYVTSLMKLEIPKLLVERSEKCFTVLEVTYVNSNNKKGLLYYGKATLTGKETDPLIHLYHLRDPIFPNESTANQKWTKEKFSAYNRLGKHVAEKVLLHYQSKCDDRSPDDTDTSGDPTNLYEEEVSVGNGNDAFSGVETSSEDSNMETETRMNAQHKPEQRKKIRM